MNKGASIAAFIFFAIAWLFSLMDTPDSIAIVNVGLMWLSLAAIIGRD